MQAVRMQATARDAAAGAGVAEGKPKLRPAIRSRSRQLRRAAAKQPATPARLRQEEPAAPTLR